MSLLAALVWAAVALLWLGKSLPPVIELDEFGVPGKIIVTEVFFAITFAIAALIGLAWIRWGWRRGLPTRLATLSLGFPPIWQASVYAADKFDFPSLRAGLANWGLAAIFCTGLAWIVWYVERRWYQVVRERRTAPVDRTAGRIWNPIDPDAWYYGRRDKLSQSLLVLLTYSLAFFLLTLLAGQVGGCREIYEMPAGGGKAETIAQTVKIQKVIKKKFIINPYSSISFRPPPIDDIKLQLTEVTAHQYKVGQGEGEGAGFSGGTSRGKVRFIRIEYIGGDWSQDFGIGADLNMLIQYNVRTGQQVAEQTESRTIPQLSNFPIGKSPPLLYITGQKNITVSKSEAKILREYLFDKHGMLFADNGGSQNWHNQFFSLMRQVAPEVEPVKVPLDDVIHRVPFAIPFLPFVAPHGGRDAWGWKVNGRWICYYHPGDIGDAWSDGHSGVKAEVWEACYQLGTNVIFYAHAEYNKWLVAQNQKK